MPQGIDLNYRFERRAAGTVSAGRLGKNHSVRLAPSPPAIRVIGVLLILLPLLICGCRTVKEVSRTCYLPPTDTFSLGLVHVIDAFRKRYADCPDIHTVSQAESRPELPRLILRLNVPPTDKVLAWLCPTDTPTTGNCVLFAQSGLYILNLLPDDVAGQQFMTYDELLDARVETDRFRTNLLRLTTSGNRTVVVNTFSYRLHDSRDFESFVRTVQTYLESPDLPDAATAAVPGGSDDSAGEPVTVARSSGTTGVAAPPGNGVRSRISGLFRQVGGRFSARRPATAEEIGRNCYTLPTDVFSLGLIQVLESFGARHPDCADLHTLRRSQGRPELPVLILRANLGTAEKALAWVSAEPLSAAPEALLFTDAGVHILRGATPGDTGTDFLGYAWVMAAELTPDPGTGRRLSLTVGNRRVDLHADNWRLPQLAPLFETIRTYLEAPGNPQTQTALLADSAGGTSIAAAAPVPDNLAVRRIRRPPPAERPTDFTGEPGEVLRKIQLHLAWLRYEVDKRLQELVSSPPDRSPGLLLRQMTAFIDEQLGALAESAGSARVRNTLAARQHQVEEALREAERQETPDGPSMAALRELLVGFARAESDLTALRSALQQLAADTRSAEQRYWDTESTSGDEKARPQVVSDVRRLQYAWWQSCAPQQN